MRATEFKKLANGEALFVGENRIVFLDLNDEDYQYFTVEEPAENNTYCKIGEFTTFEEAVNIAKDVYSYKYDMERAWGMPWSKIRETLSL